MTTEIGYDFVRHSCTTDNVMKSQVTKVVAEVEASSAEETESCSWAS